jgi:hypothetical protein
MTFRSKHVSCLIDYFRFVNIRLMESAGRSESRAAGKALKLD